ncbi:hypothetical protein MOUN0_K05820 [Monosporozyma unispora]|nr:hypothetical protein C6P44_004455 [Kazachstania unispora]
MTESISSFASRDISSVVSLNNYINEGNLSTRALYELEPSENALSRPLSRCSATSGLSITGTKDGIEGKRVIRTGLNQYSLSLLDTKHHNMKQQLQPSSESISRSSSKFYLDKHGNSIPNIRYNSNNYYNTNNNNILENENNSENQQYQEYMSSTCSTPVYPDCPTSPPMTLKEKMKLLNIDRHNNTNENCNPPTCNTNNPILHNKVNDPIALNNIIDNTSIDDMLQPDKNNPPNNNKDIFDNDYSTSNIDYELNIYHPHIKGDLESNASTLGDDVSYLLTFKHLKDKENFGLDDNSNVNSNSQIQLFQSSEAME